MTEVVGAFAFGTGRLSDGLAAMHSASNSVRRVCVRRGALAERVAWVGYFERYQWLDPRRDGGACERDGANVLLCLCGHQLLILLMTFAELGYAGMLKIIVRAEGSYLGLGPGFMLASIKRQENLKAFIELATLLVIERNFG